MATDTAKQLHDKINNLIDTGHIQEALNDLRASMPSSSPSSLLDLLSTNESTYKYMLHYLAEGYADASRDKIIKDVANNLRFVNDSIYRNKISTDSPELYASTLRLNKVRKNEVEAKLSDALKYGSLASLAKDNGSNPSVIKKADDATSELFSAVWTMFGASQHTYSKLLEAAVDPGTPSSIKSQIISALLLGCLKYYDRFALSTLIDIFEADINPKISARALVAIVLIVAAHPARVSDDTGIAARMSLWEDSLVIYRQLREVVMAIIKAHDTERISSKMKNEVLPELMKLRPDILNKLKDASQFQDMNSLDENPEWEEILEKNGLGDKLRELTDMQLEGGDVMMMAFSNLKGFPFFNDISNWFLPFSVSQHDVHAESEKWLGTFSEMLEMEGIMCNSDKYSFVFSLNRMPEEQRKEICRKMDAQTEQLKEAIAERKLKSTVPEFDSEATRYVRDLYRFFKLFRRKDEFFDPFARPLDFLSLPFIGGVLSDNEILSLVSEFYFKRKYYQEAIPMFLKLDLPGTPDTQLWEKIGHSYAGLGNHSEALNWFRKAELLYPDSPWLIKSMAREFELSGHPKDAAEYYLKALDTDPENRDLILKCAHVLMRVDHKEALKHFFHADYLLSDPLSLRGIAWGEMLNKNYDKSLEAYVTLQSMTDASANDLVNAGHVWLLKGDFKKAITVYSDAVKKTGYGISNLEKEFKEDSETLKSLGIDPALLHLILEKIRFDLQ